MAQNEIKAKPALPERVRSMEGLGIALAAPPHGQAALLYLLAVGICLREVFLAHNVPENESNDAYDCQYLPPRQIGLPLSSRLEVKNSR